MLLKRLQSLTPCHYYQTKDSLTIFLAGKTIQINIFMMTSTQLGVLYNQGTIDPVTASSHEETDTIMVLHVIELFATGKKIHLITKDIYFGA